MPWLSVCATYPQTDLERGIMEASWGLGVYLTDEDLEVDDDE